MAESEVLMEKKKRELERKQKEKEDNELKRLEYETKPGSQNVEYYKKDVSLHIVTGPESAQRVYIIREPASATNL